MRKTPALLSTGLISALALTACGGSSEEAPGSNGGTDVEIHPELNIAYNAQPSTIDPLLSTAHVSRIIARLYFEPLLVIDADGAVQPVLAEDYEVSEDGLTITFTLREDVPFHDGSIMEAEDVVASLERWVDLTNIGQIYFSEATVESSEEGVVTFEMAEPNQVAPSLLADPTQMPYIMPAQVIEEAGGEGIQDSIGTGPYQFGTWETDQHIRLDRFEDYVSPEGEPNGLAGAKEAYFEEMYFHFISDSSTRVAGLQTGEWDIASPVPWDNAKAVEEDPNSVVELGEAGVTIGIFNKDQGVFTDHAMRQAAVAAVDPEEVLLAAYGSEEYYALNAALMPEDSPWHVEPTAEQEEIYLEQDITAAKAYLEEAGYDGEEIRILATSDNDDHYNTAVVLQQHLEEAGMNIDLVITDWPTVLQGQEDPTAYDINITNIANWPVVPATFQFFNPTWTGWTDSDEIADALDNMLYAEDEDGVAEAMAELQQADYDYLPVIRFGDRRVPTGVSSQFEGFEHATGTGEIFHHVRPVE